MGGCRYDFVMLDDRVIIRWPARAWAAVIMAAGTLVVGPATVARAVDAQELLQQAVTELGYFSFEKAYRLFKTVWEDAAEGSERWQQAIYGTAVCAHHISPASPGRIAEAATLYRRLIERSPDSRYAPRAMMNLGRIEELSDYYRDVVDLEAARGWYQQVVERWPDRPIAGEATLRIGASYIQTYDEAQVRRGVAIIESWLERHPGDELASAMWQYLGDTYFYPLEQYQRSLDCYLKADAIGLVEKGREGPVYWRMAVMADRHLNNRAVAVEYYTKVIVKTPTSGKGYEAQRALQRLGAPVPRLEFFEVMELDGDRAPAEQEPPR
jgi:tetratricopeptide (TPR) repeat protein